MRIKIGNLWFDSRNTAIMVVLSDEDKANIAMMSPTARMYCQYNASKATPEQVRAWMAEPPMGLDIMENEKYASLEAVIDPVTPPMGLRMSSEPALAADPPAPERKSRKLRDLFRFRK